MPGVGAEGSEGRADTCCGRLRAAAAVRDHLAGRGSVRGLGTEPTRLEAGQPGEPAVAIGFADQATLNPLPSGTSVEGIAPAPRAREDGSFGSP